MEKLLRSLLLWGTPVGITSIVMFCGSFYLAFLFKEGFPLLHTVTLLIELHL